MKNEALGIKLGICLEKNKSKRAKIGGVSFVKDAPKGGFYDLHDYLLRRCMEIM